MQNRPFNFNADGGMQPHGWYAVGMPPQEATQHVHVQHQQQHPQYPTMPLPMVDPTQYWAYHQGVAAGYSAQPQPASPPYFHGHSAQTTPFVHPAAFPAQYQPQLQVPNTGAPMYYVASPAGGQPHLSFVPFVQSASPHAQQRGDQTGASAASVPLVGSPLLTSCHASLGSSHTERASSAQHFQESGVVASIGGPLPQPLRLARFAGSDQQHLVHSPMLASVSVADDSVVDLGASSFSRTLGSLATANLPPPNSIGPPTPSNVMPPSATVVRSVPQGDQMASKQNHTQPHAGPSLSNSLSGSNALSVTANHTANSQTLLQHTCGDNAAAFGGPLLPQWTHAQVMVNYLDPIVNAQELNSLFRQYGETRGAKIIYDSDNQSRGYGFVYFCDAEDARTAVDRSDGMVHRGKRLRVHFSNRPNPSFI